MRRSAFSLALAIAVGSAALPCAAAPGDFERMRGQTLARSGRCEEAIPDLEKAEAIEHRPATAETLAGCREMTGDLLAAHAIYQRMAGERPLYGRWDFYDMSAYKRAGANAKRVDARIPSLEIRPAETYADLEVTVDGVATPIDQVLRFNPAKVHVEATAAGCEPFETWLELTAGARKVLELRLEKRPTVVKPAPARPRPRPKPKAKPEPSDEPAVWLGARFVGLILPRFLMNAVGEGGAE